MTKSQYGYYDSPEQTAPVYDPGVIDVLCPICGKTLTDREAQDRSFCNSIRTISLLVLGDSRSYFYRVHATCHEPLSQSQRSSIDGLLIDAIAGAQKNVN
jgi:hypothetical protein